MELAFNPAIPLLGINPKNPKILILNNICTPMFIAGLFTIAMIWNQPKCQSVDEWIKQSMVHTHNGRLCSSKKEGIPTFCDSVDGTGDYYAK